MPVASLAVIIRLAPVLLIFSLCSTGKAQTGGISLGQTRVVFPAAGKSQTLAVKNSGSQAYLIQSRVHRSLDDEAPAPFIVTPPLFALKADSQQLLRILPQEATLPADRESLFYLSVQAIPAQTEAEHANSRHSRLSLGLYFMIKLFYRPDGLRPSPDDAACQLRFSHRAQRLQVSNPTPYFQTFGRLMLDNKAFDLNSQPSMIAPLSTLNYSTSGPANLIEWQTITDYGGLSPSCQQTISSLPEGS